MNLTPEQEISRVKKLVSSAKAMLSGQVGITVGAMAVSNKLNWLGDDWVGKYPIFKEYYCAIPTELPIGSERLHWNLDKLLNLDPELAQLEYKYRPKLFQTCCIIIKCHS